MPTVTRFKHVRSPVLITALAFALLSCRDDTPPAPEPSPVPEVPPPFTIGPDSDVAGLQAAMAAGHIRATDITQYYLDRIAELNPELAAVLEINPDALAIAAELDAERRAGTVRSPLHGIPVLLKDNIDTADKMKTTAGSLALMDAPVPAKDAFVVQQLRAAGAVVLGKTNLSEWANFRSSKASSGWSARGGQTRNPYNRNITPCGSSSGSGVAVAAGLTVLAIGTETDGSIICPASNNGIVGIKPTIGLISRSGIIPISHSQDTAGPMARTVADAAAALTVMAGVDAGDPITALLNAPYTDYRLSLMAGGLQGKRIGVMRHLDGRNPAVDELMNARIALMRDAGATVIDVHPEIPQGLSEAEYLVLLYEFRFGLDKYLATRGGEHQSLDDIIGFNMDNAARQMAYFGQDIFLEASSKGDLSSSEYQEALRFSKSSSQGLLDSLLRGESLDALIGPSNGPGWQIDLQNGDNSSSVNYVSSASLAAISGYPSITVPAGFINGLPIGLSFIGPVFSEPELISIAYDFEQKTLARQAP